MARSTGGREATVEGFPVASGWPARSVTIRARELHRAVIAVQGQKAGVAEGGHDAIELGLVTVVRGADARQRHAACRVAGGGDFTLKTAQDRAAAGIRAQLVVLDDIVPAGIAMPGLLRIRRGAGKQDGGEGEACSADHQDLPLLVMPGHLAGLRLRGPDAFPTKTTFAVAVSKNLAFERAWVRKNIGDLLFGRFSSGLLIRSALALAPFLDKSVGSTREFGRWGMTERPAPIQVPFRLGGILVDPGRGTLTLGETTRRVEPRVMDVLCMLAAHAGEGVRREALLDAVWGDIIGNDEALTRAVSRLRSELRAFGSDALVETLPKRGYRLTCAVVEPEPRDGTPQPARSRLPQPGLPRFKPGRAWAAGAVAALAVLVALFFVWPRQGTIEGSVALRFDVPGDTGRDIDRAFRALNVDRTIFAVTPARSEFVASIVSAGETGGGPLGVNLTDRQSGAVLLTQPFEQDGRDIADLARHIAMVLTADLRCLGELRSLAEPGIGGDSRVVSRFLALCAEVRSGARNVPPETLTADLLELYPDSAFMHGLHAVTLMSRPEQHFFAQADSRAGQIAATANRLIGNARRLDPDAPVLAYAEALASMYGSSRAQQVAVFATLPRSSWLGLQVQNRYFDILRQTGQELEAFRLAEDLESIWPVHFQTSAFMAIALVQRGLASEAVAFIEQKSRLFPDARHLQGLAMVAQLHYGEPDAAMEVVRAVLPPEAHPCALAYLSARRDGVPVAERVDLDGCDNIDTTQVARMHAVTRDWPRALESIALFDPRAAQLAVVLHYPEFDPLWAETAMWEQADAFGLVEFWQATGTRPDVCRRPNMVTVCEREIVSRVAR